MVSLRHLEILYGVAGAREKFEEMTVHLIHSQHPTAERVRIVRGDGGIDAHDGKLADPAGVDVFQMKYFPDKIEESQRNQIRDSFKRARDNKDFKTKSWTLRLPIDLSTDEKKWFDDWTGKQTDSGIEIRPVWGAFAIERLLMADQNREIRETYFQQEHLQRLGEIDGNLQQLLQEFVDRVPRSAPIVLRAGLESVGFAGVIAGPPNTAYIQVILRFSIKNSGNSAARCWDVSIDFEPPSGTFADRFEKDHSEPSHEVILPTGSAKKTVGFTFRVENDWCPIILQLGDRLSKTLVRYRIVSEDCVGESCTTSLSDVMEFDGFARNVQNALKNTPSWQR